VSACRGEAALRLIDPRKLYSILRPGSINRLIVNNPTVAHSYNAAVIRRPICRRFGTEPEPTGSGPNQGSGIILAFIVVSEYKYAAKHFCKMFPGRE